MTFEQRDVLETTEFFLILLIEQKNVSFDHVIEISNEPDRPGSVMPLFDWTFLSQFTK